MFAACVEKNIVGQLKKNRAIKFIKTVFTSYTRILLDRSRKKYWERSNPYDGEGLQVLRTLMIPREVKLLSVLPQEFSNMNGIL